MVAWRLVGVWQPCLWRTAEGKIEDQKEFVRWWKETVRREGQTEKTSADRGTFLPMSEAEVRKASVAFLRKFWPARRVGQTSAGHLSESCAKQREMDLSNLPRATSDACRRPALRALAKLKVGSVPPRPFSSAAGAASRVDGVQGGVALATGRADYSRRFAPLSHPRARW
jgi:hypothetical protein